MKRLIKKSELYNEYKNTKYVADYSVYKNPTPEEIEKCKKGKYCDGDVRGCLTNGDIYIWPAFAWHDINQRISGLNCDLRFMFNNDDNKLSLDSSVNFSIKTIEDIYESFSPYSQKLLNTFGNIRCKVTGWEAEFTGSLKGFFDKNFEEIDGYEEEYGIKNYTDGGGN